MVAVVVISSTVFLAVDLTYRCLGIVLLEVEMALEVKITWDEDVDSQDGGSNTLCGVGTFRTQFERLRVQVHGFSLFNDSVHERLSV